VNAFIKEVHFMATLYDNHIFRENYTF